MTAPTGPATTHERARREANRTLHQLARATLIFFGSTPLWLPLARAHLPLGSVGELIDSLFILLCHRLPERTMDVAGVAMPVCSRCAGIFFGLACGGLSNWPHFSVKRGRLAVFIAGLVMLADVVTQDLGIHPVWHATRLGSGILLGWLAAATLMSAIRRSGRAIDRVAATAPEGAD